MLPTCNDRSDRVSAALAAFVFHEGFFRTRTGSAIGWSTRGADAPGRPGGPRASSRPAAGGCITGRAVAEAGPDGVRLARRRAGSTADAVVLALPPARAREVAPAALPEDPGLGASPIVNVHVWYDRPVMDEPFIAVLDSPAQWVFNRTAMAGLPGPGQHLAVSVSGARDEVLRAEGRADRRASPRSWRGPLSPRPGAPVERVAVVKEPEATFAAAPGQAARRPGPGRPRWTASYLAGAWTDTGWPATMEGAVRSGVRAARLAAADG